MKNTMSKKKKIIIIFSIMIINIMLIGVVLTVMQQSDAKTVLKYQRYYNQCLDITDSNLQSECRKGYGIRILETEQEYVYRYSYGIIGVTNMLIALHLVIPFSISIIIIWYILENEHIDVQM